MLWSQSEGRAGVHDSLKGDRNDNSDWLLLVPTFNPHSTGIKMTILTDLYQLQSLNPHSTGIKMTIVTDLYQSQSVGPHRTGIKMTILTDLVSKITILTDLYQF